MIGRTGDDGDRQPSQYQKLQVSLLLRYKVGWVLLRLVVDRKHRFCLA